MDVKGLQKNKNIRKMWALKVVWILAQQKYFSVCVFLDNMTDKLLYYK